MRKFRILITDHKFSNVKHEQEIIESAGGELKISQCRTGDEVIETACGADGLIVQYAPIDEKVIEKLEKCKIIVCYGIGYNNINVKAAAQKNITVCNVPDYCIDEVADHTMALAISLARQIPVIDKRVKNGIWKLIPEFSMPAFRDMTFSTVGLGSIGQAVLERAEVFKFKLAAYDPYVDDAVFQGSKINKISLETLFSESDIISLNAPLTPKTKHIINSESLAAMKLNAIVINTSRGGLIDTEALAEALKSRRIAYAGLDVLEQEPAAGNNPLFSLNNVVITSHIAYYSQASITRLQCSAAEEIVRFFSGKEVENRVFE